MIVSLFFSPLLTFVLVQDFYTHPYIDCSSFLYCVGVWVEASIERHLSSSMALMKYKAGAFSPNQHAGNCMRQKWISRHSWSLWRELSHFFSPLTTCVLIFCIAKGDKQADIFISHQLRHDRIDHSQLLKKTWYTRGAWPSHTSFFVIGCLEVFFPTSLVSCFKSRHMNLCHILFPFK